MAKESIISMMGHMRMEPQPFTRFTLAGWGAAYREFVNRMKYLWRWPFPTREERKEAWQEWCLLNIYCIGE